MPDTTSLLLTAQVLEEFETVSGSMAAVKDQPSKQLHVQFTLHIKLGGMPKQSQSASFSTDRLILGPG
jgi:hypothetical protein